MAPSVPDADFCAAGETRRGRRDDAAARANFSILGGRGVADCPACGGQVVDLERKATVRGVLCELCGACLEVRGGLVEVADATSIADEPVFAAALTETVVW